MTFSESDLVCVMRPSYKWVTDHYQVHLRLRYYRYENFKANKEPIVEYTGFLEGFFQMKYTPLNNHSKITWSIRTNKPEETSTIFIFSIDSQIKGNLQTFKVDMIEVYENVLKPKIKRL